MPTVQQQVVSLIVGLSVLTVRPCRAASPPGRQPATTQPQQVTERQSSILLQLSNAEANIKAINKALKLTGYKVGVAYDQIEGSEKANELMDRRGGGPVPWDQFYGRTTMSFYHHASANAHVEESHGAATLDAQWTSSRLMPIDRPAQFESIYRANGQQVVRAQEQIATLLKNQAALLARRKKHETDQSALWATLAWERVRDREIAYRSLYQRQLGPAGPRVELLRGPILFLRTTDRAVSDALDQITADQPAAFEDLRARTRDAYVTLLRTAADRLAAQGLSADDVAEGQALKSVCKQIAEQCVVTDANCRLALDSDRAREDASKLEYRAELQTSLAKLTGMIGVLDDRLASAADAYSIKPLPGTESPDRIPAAPPRPSKPAATTRVGDVTTPTEDASTAGHVDEMAIVQDGWTIMFRARDPLAWNFPIRSPDIYAVPMSAAPAHFRYLRMRRMDTGEAVIIESDGFPHSLPKDGTPWFRVDKAIGRGGCELGIIDLQHKVDPATVPSLAVMPAGNFGGWGFGTHELGSGQGYVWDNHEIGQTTFEIAVTARPLRADEREQLVRP